MTTSQTRAHCNQCGGSRWHEVLHALKEQTAGNESRVVKYELLRCAGCDEVKLRKTELASSDRSIDTEVRPKVTYYPPSSIRPQPRWLQELMFEEWVGDATAEHALLIEVYSALENEAPALAAMGLRAIIETIMINTVKDQGSFTKNLAAMRDKGVISQFDIDSLNAVIEIGSAAIHRSHLPSADNVLRALDIAETLVKRVHIDKNLVSEIKKSTPRRGPRT